VETCVRAAYRPRDAAGSPLYRSVLDHLETYLAARTRGGKDASNSAAEDSLRSFLQCGIPRFGVARFRCKDGEEHGRQGQKAMREHPVTIFRRRASHKDYPACAALVLDKTTRPTYAP
jgi:hypothetical protein